MVGHLRHVSPYVHGLSRKQLAMESKKTDAQWLEEIEELQSDVGKWKGYFQEEQQRCTEALNRADKYYRRMLAAYTLLLWISTITRSE